TWEEFEKDFIENLKHGGGFGEILTIRLCSDCKLCVRNYCYFYNQVAYEVERKKFAKTDYLKDEPKPDDLCTHYVKDKYSFETKFMRDFIDPNYEPKEEEKDKKN
ncbi:MAG: hypothetical protein LBV51_02450, partial [Acholeplasmatales bacterium]|nr:hypothetical protein [Acholeplasmatales bacterium]